MAYRFIAQRPQTGNFLDWDLELTAASNPRRDLSGPGSLIATIEPEMGRLIADDGDLVIDEWNTSIFVEEDGKIKWGGLVTGSGWVGQKWQITCAGFNAYPHGIPFLDSIRSGRKRADGTISDRLDAFEVVRRIWSHLQSYTNGDLGVQVTATDSGVLLGAPDGSDPYELVWWEAPDCGEAIDNLATQVGFDYIELHQWNSDKSAILHKLQLDRNIGARRTDLRFATGENIIAVAEPQRMGEAFANTILALGKGSGKDMLRAIVGEREGHLRRVAVTSHKNVGNLDHLTRIARRELVEHAEQYVVPMIQVKEHPNAQIGSWKLGDEILLDVELPWLGHRTMWHRIVADEISLDGTATLTLAIPGLT